ncbi:hypothetical protein ACVWWU_000534 [Pantoea sp. PA1]|jgi:hypothetical protein|nr:MULTISPECIES: hypothetical protein [Pantoea]AER32861.1 hypothetical protein PAGR_g2352 [Pantoea ananatis PA13]AMB75687.1 hypothetical protein AW734_13515 [Pantoea ananatis]ASN15404.1 hypothetical protein B7764_09400 [Pantoea ananatis]AVG76813.1 hypothetical protein B9Q16_12700 [Pantoea ananatis]ERM14760.1 hypothetical protein L585_06750 [Pantoea ananatis BRT175]
MVNDYFSLPPAGMTQEQHKRTVAVAAALAVAKESVSASTSANGSKAAWDLQAVANEIANLADAIQDALESDNEV